jgi:short-subunit dehydrogenase
MIHLVAQPACAGIAPCEAADDRRSELSQGDVRPRTIAHGRNVFHPTLPQRSRSTSSSRSLLATIAQCEVAELPVRAVPEFNAGSPAPGDAHSPDRVLPRRFDCPRMNPHSSQPRATGGFPRIAGRHGSQKEHPMPSKPSRAVLITGCSTGIGRASALRLAKAGHTVYATARRLDSIRDLETAGCRTLELDVCNDESMQRAVAAVESAEGAVGVLVNNAGYGSDGTIEEVPMAEVRRQFETNVFGLARMTQLVLPGMRAQRYGRILNISSMGGRMTLPGGGYYHATKYAVEAISDALRFEVAGFGIDVVVIEPGIIKTEFANTAVDRVRAAGAPTSPYAAFNNSLAKSLEDISAGKMDAIAAGPDKVAQVIERAITASRPKTRYLITAGAHLFVRLRRLLGDRGFDLFLRTQFPRPGVAS